MYQKHLNRDFMYYFTDEKGLIMWNLYDSKTNTTKLAMTRYKKVAERWEKQINDKNSGLIALRF